MVPRSVFQETTVIGKITSAVATNEPVHLVPSATNFPAVDSIIYYPNDVLTCIQTTINDDHPIAVSGLRRIQSWLQSPLGDLRPKKKEGSRWRFIFIVPENMAPTFRLQDFKGDTDKDEWAGKVVQYVFGLEVFRPS
jgi:hypothetical protein